MGADCDCSGVMRCDALPRHGLVHCHTLSLWRPHKGQAMREQSRMCGLLPLPFVRIENIMFHYGGTSGCQLDQRLEYGANAVLHRTTGTGSPCMDMFKTYP